MITDKQRREAVEFLRSGTCLYFAEHRKLELDFGGVCEWRVGHL